MPLNDLISFEGSTFSQNGEDGVLAEIFAQIGTTNRYFVEFGCEDAVECNTSRLLQRGWKGLLMDPAGVSRNPQAPVHKEFVTAENIASLLEKYGVPESFDLLSIDIDGNDYWVWKAIDHRPRVVVIEYNAHISVQESKTVPYDPGFVWSGTDYFGASLKALQELGKSKGYTLVYCERAGVNAFFIESSALPFDFIPPPIESVYRPPNYGGHGGRHPADPDRKMINVSILDDVP